MVAGIEKDLDSSLTPSDPDARATHRDRTSLTALTLLSRALRDPDVHVRATLRRRARLPAAACGLPGVAQRQELHVLRANFRNTLSVTRLANTLLKIKQARFGSVDRESNFLVQATSADAGRVDLLPLKDATLKALDAATRASAQHAVIGERPGVPPCLPGIGA
jgi:hypothetical protein